MLGVADVTVDDPADQLLHEFGRHIGVEKSYAKTRVGVYFGEPGVTVDDPFFGGEGPPRTGCQFIGRCMVGCPVGAKNTLEKNYLWFAERRGARIRPERTVVDVRPLGAGDGSDGYEVVHERSGAWLRKDRQVLRARGVVVAAGALGTNRLLQLCKRNGSLRVSERLGELVRTNSEAILAVTLPEAIGRGHDQARGDQRLDLPRPRHAHRDGQLRRGRRQHQLPLHAARRRRDARHPAVEVARRAAAPSGQGAEGAQPPRLVAQHDHPARDADARQRDRAAPQADAPSADCACRPSRTRPSPTRRSSPWPTRPRSGSPQRTGGIAQSSITEALMNIPTTAHILGGAVIGASPDEGVVDARQRLFGYENLLVCDGSVVPANIGVNPSLTITALAERAMTFVKDSGAWSSTATASAASPNGSTPRSTSAPAPPESLFERAGQVLSGGVASSYQVARAVADLPRARQGPEGLGRRRQRAVGLPQRLRLDGPGPRAPGDRQGDQGALRPRHALRRADRGRGRRRRGARARASGCPSGATRTPAPSRRWTRSGSPAR